MHKAAPVIPPRSLRPTYHDDIGDFAEATIRAPWDLSIEDDVATSRMRDEAARFAAPLARFDASPATTAPARIEEFAREHQGTGVLTVFQQKAEATGDPVNPDDFRYPGPRPGSRETAILLMADKIAATARSVGAKTTEEFRAVVDRTIDDLQATGQFDGSPLTLRDLTLVRQAFATALGDIYHTRVAYPAATVPAGPVGRV